MKKFIYGTIFGLFLFFMFIYITGCTTEGTKRFNTEDTQDGTCYGQYGGQFGYCNRSPK